MINEKFVIVGAILNFMGTATYIWNTVKGKTKPNRVSWFLWALAPFIAFFAQIHDGIGLQSLMTFMVGFTSLMVLLASLLNKKAYWKITKLDIGCGSLSMIALILWATTGSDITAIGLSIAADLLAATPTLIKSFRAPDTEHPDAYRNGALSAGITLLTIKNWSFTTYGFALYMLLMCSTLYVFIRFRVGRLIMKRVASA